MVVSDIRIVKKVNTAVNASGINVLKAEKIKKDKTKNTPIKAMCFNSQNHITGFAFRLSGYW